MINNKLYSYVMFFSNTIILFKKKFLYKFVKKIDGGKKKAKQEWQFLRKFD